MMLSEAENEITIKNMQKQILIKDRQIKTLMGIVRRLTANQPDDIELD